MIKRMIKVVALFAIGFAIFSQAQAFAQSLGTKQKFYRVLLLTIDNQDLYDRYRRSTKDIVKQMGGLIERELEVMGAPKGPMDIGLPNRVVVMSFDTPDGAERLKVHQEYVKFVSIRDRGLSAVKIFIGDNIFSDGSTSDLDKRMYLLKVSSYYKGRVNRINALNDINERLRQYGFHTEKKIHVRKSIGINDVDEVALHFHDHFQQNDQLHQDAEVMGMIGSYNQIYVKNYVYLGLKTI